MKQRPSGITILSILALIGGLGILITQIIYRDNLGNISSDMGISTITVVISFFFLAAISIGSGIGMWMGKIWGWWLGTFYYVYAILRYANSIVNVILLSDQMLNATRGAGYYYALYSGRIVIHFLIFLYFFRDNVMQYFEVTHYPKRKYALTILGVGIVIYGIFTLISLTT